MLTIIGGIYYEVCNVPSYEELVGSGMRAALALTETVSNITLIGCISSADKNAVESECSLHGIGCQLTLIPTTITFEYFHPLSCPEFYPYQSAPDIILPNVSAKAILYYGTIESTATVDADYLVYDPQNGQMMASESYTTRHLALVLNLKEAILLSGFDNDAELKNIGREVLRKHHAEVVVIKNGAKGAYVFHADQMDLVPVFETQTVWPIGSGDIFSAVFAREWAVHNKPAKDAARIASQSVAHFCETQQLPLPIQLPERPARKATNAIKTVYLAGPFLSIAQRWLIEELRSLLYEFGHHVFSPFHEVGTNQSNEEIADADLKGLLECDIVLAVVTGLDPGTLFEVGYARSKDIPVVVLTELESDEDLLMLKGSGCTITRDITNAIYKTAW